MLPCARRPEAAALMAPLFEHYGVQPWLPETGGPAAFGDQEHEEAMLALGVQSKREITRTRIRVRTAMACAVPKPCAGV